MIGYIWNRILALVREEEAQDGFEYMLVVGGVSVAVILALLAIGPGAVAEAVCGAIAGIPGFSSFPACPA